MTALVRKLSAPYAFGWTLRRKEDTDVVETPLGDGRHEVLINHNRLDGVTTEMLGWWFQNIDGLATYKGKRLPAYHLWHPYDHVGVTFHRGASGRVEPGQALGIQEVFGRDPRYAADVTSVIHRWDKRGIGFHYDVFGHRVVELDHVFADVAGGLDYRTRLRVGVGVGPLRNFINKRFVARRFNADYTSAWIKHNIEEVGCFVDFLPEIFEGKAIEARRK